MPQGRGCEQTATVDKNRRRSMLVSRERGAGRLGVSVG